MSGFTEIELRDPCDNCEGRGYFINHSMLILFRPSDITKEHLITCSQCNGSGVIDTYDNKNINTTNSL